MSGSIRSLGLTAAGTARRYRAGSLHLGVPVPREPGEEAASPDDGVVSELVPYRVEPVAVGYRTGGGR